MCRTGVKECFGNKLFAGQVSAGQAKHNRSKKPFQLCGSATYFLCGLKFIFVVKTSESVTLIHKADLPPTCRLSSQLAVLHPSSDKGLLTTSQNICRLTYKHLSHEAIFILSPALLIVLPSPSSLCHFAGDYILETKPKEISEAQRLNYEQVRPALSLRDFIIFIKQRCALCLWV